jgi:hypothetical protein
MASAVALSAVTVCAELVYDNSREYSTNFVAYSFEYGDEIRLAGSARTVTRFQFEYYGDFTSQGIAKVTLRFYANDGPGQFRSPGTLLYQSEPLDLYAGFHALLIGGLSVDVPGTFTWTVRFTGLAMVKGDQAGLVLYAQPTVGKSFDDYWQKSGSTWELYRFGGNPIANFAARVYAAPDPPVSFRDSRRLPNGSFQTVLSGPIDGRFQIQVSSDLQQWAPLTIITFPASTLDFLDSQAALSDRRFYRAVSPPSVPP